VLVVSRFTVSAAEEEFLDRARAALSALAGRPGYLRGRLARALDDPAYWCLTTEWESVGAYRRALSAYEVKLHASPLLAESIDEPSAYEPLVEAAADGTVTVRTSDRADPALGHVRADEAYPDRPRSRS